MGCAFEQDFMRLDAGPAEEVPGTPEGTSRPAEPAAEFVGATCIDFSKVGCLNHRLLLHSSLENPL